MLSGSECAVRNSIWRCFDAAGQLNSMLCGPKVLAAKGGMTGAVMDEIDIKARNTAIARFVEGAIIPILFESVRLAGRKAAGTHATGTLFCFDNQHFMITASHVIEGHEKLGV